MGPGRGTPGPWALGLSEQLELLLVLPAAMWSFRPRWWWARFPFLPVPEPTYVRWRMATAYGASGRRLTWADLTGWARWSWRLRHYAERSRR